jgi:hypothetical protein
MKQYLLALTLFSAVWAEELVINLKDPTFHQGVITTEDGGIITGDQLRIQARKIVYTNKVENGVPMKRIVAEGDLLLEYAGRPFVGEKLEYDFLSKSGTLYNGRTSADYWFIGGDEIKLEPDGSYLVENAYITTVEGQDAWWELRSSQIGIQEKNLLSAKNIKFNFFNFPLLWLPSFKLNLKWFRGDSPIRYKFIWDQILKQKVSMRYEVFSNENLGVWARFDYQFKYGPGGAIETDYRSADERTTFKTRNYGGYGKFIPQQKSKNQFRFQGQWLTTSEDNKTHVHMTYDKMSSIKMPQDFKSDDFEINTQKRTIFFVTHQEENIFSRFNFQPRINRFQSINQQLPLFTADIRPLSLGKSGLISENWFSAGYLDYVFASRLSRELPSTRAGRFEMNSSLYRPLNLGPIILTPLIGGVGIFYTNSPQHQTTGQGIGVYGGDLNLPLSRSYERVTHTLKPYANFLGLTHPTSGLNNHYIFDINDGYQTLNQLKTGFRQEFFSRRKFKFLPNFALDLYAYGFFGKTAFHRTFPKSYLDFEIHRPSFAIISTISYNMQQMLWDYVNIRTDWTVSEDVALGFDYRHRSKFDWRKADPDNFILDVSRPISQLVHSPISDGRNTFFTRLYVRFSPTWTLQFESHSGWGRRDEPNYNEFNLKLSTFVTGKWKLELGLSYDPAKKWQAIYPTFKLTG